MFVVTDKSWPVLAQICAVIDEKPEEWAGFVTILVPKTGIGSADPAMSTDTSDLAQVISVLSYVICAIASDLSAIIPRETMPDAGY
jgi:hypothetical protein